MKRDQPVELVILQAGRMIFSTDADLQVPPAEDDPNVVDFGTVDAHGDSQPTLELKNMGYEKAYDIRVTVESVGNLSPEVTGYPKQLGPGESKPLLAKWTPTVVGNPWVWGQFHIQFGYIVRPRGRKPPVIQ